MVCSGALAAVREDVAVGVTGAVAVAAGPGSLEAEGALTGLVSIPALWVDFSAVVTRVTSRATSARRAAVATREEMFKTAMSAHQSANDGRHAVDYLLGHGGEYLVLAPVRVNDICRLKCERGFEAATCGGFLC
jgi:hypothetical protein